jgi:hypothetical protein
MPILRETSFNNAIGHALWEAHACIGQWAFCACLAMLRKALDLWSSDYRDKQGMSFNKGENDNLFWRLKKIAEGNALYRDSIHQIIDAIRLDANDAVHNCFVCSGGHVGTRDGPTISALRAPVQKLHQLVVNLITTTTRDIEIVYSDESRWKTTPPYITKSEYLASTIPFDELENKLPELLAEMRTDLKASPLVREFVLLGKGWVFNSDPNNPVFHYYFDDHPNLKSKLSILQHYGLIKDTTFNNVDRFRFTEEFVNYLTK